MTNNIQTQLNGLFNALHLDYEHSINIKFLHS